MDQPETLRDEARIIAYWMSGSLRFAGDLAEDALFRMERQPDLAGEPDDPGDHGDSGCFGARRAWLLGYTARTCQDALADLPPRSLPAMLHPPADPSLPPAPAAESAAWLEPFPDELYPERYQERCHYEERSDEVILSSPPERLLRFARNDKGHFRAGSASVTKRGRASPSPSSPPCSWCRCRRAPPWSCTT